MMALLRKREGGAPRCAMWLRSATAAADFMTSCEFLSPGGAAACRADKRSLRKSETRCVLLGHTTAPRHVRRAHYACTMSSQSRASGRGSLECHHFRPQTEVVCHKSKYQSTHQCKFQHLIINSRKVGTF